MSARRLTLTVLVWLCGAAGCLALVEASAYGETLHQYLSQITEVPASSGAASTGPFRQVTQMTVDSGHLWVDEFVGGEAGRTDEFDDATGAWLSQLPLQPGYPWEGIAVNHATGEVYVAGGLSNVAVFSAGGALEATWDGADTPIGSFGCTGCLGGYFDDVAVDNSTTSPAAGDVYVANPQHGVVDVLKPQAGGSEPPAEDVTQLLGTCSVEGTTCAPSEVIPFSEPTQVAVDASTGDVIVFDSGNGVVDVFKPEPLGGYEFVRSITGPSPSEQLGRCGIGVDSGNGDIYAACHGNLEENAVYQFSAEGVFLGRMTGTPTGSFQQLTSVAVDPESHDVYVGEAAGVVDVFGPNVVIPDVTTGPVTELKPTSATLTGTVTLDHEGEATCRFEWGTTTAFGHIAPCSALAGEEESHVHATLGGLESGTTYCYRLQATNKNGTNPGLASQDKCFKTPGPGIRAESVTRVAATSATLQASIDPDGAPTSSYFQYGTSTAYEASAPTPPGLSIGSGEGEVEAGQHVRGLAASTTYHYRVVVVSELEVSPGAFEAVEIDGTDHTFTTQTTASGELPDGRGWELVSPANKLGALLEPVGRFQVFAMQAAAQGGGVTYLASSPTESTAAGNPYYTQVLSWRGSDGWSTRDLVVPHESSIETNQHPEWPAFSEDLSLAVVQPLGPFDPGLSSAGSEQTPYSYDVFQGGSPVDPGVSGACISLCYSPLVTAMNAPGVEFGVNEGGIFSATAEQCPPQPFCGPQLEAASPNLKHVVVHSRVALTEGSPASGGLFEASEGRLTFLGEGQVGAGGVERNTSSFLVAGEHDVSTDGSRVVFNGDKENGSGPLYLFDSVTGRKLQLGGSGTTFVTASADDSRVFFENTSGGPLEECEIAEEESGELQCNRSGKPLDVSSGATVLAPVPGASEDGSSIYFVSTGVIAGSEPAPDGEPPQAGQPNLYLSQDGTTRLVAVLAAGDSSDWGNEDYLTGSKLRGPRSALTSLTARVSPDGRWVAFESRRSLTGYDNRDVKTGNSDSEVFLYHAATGGRPASLICASCDTTDGRPAGSASVPGWTSSFYQSRYLSDGGRLFFDTPDQLVPQDTNQAGDVYEYEPVVGAGGGSESSAEAPASDSCSTGSSTYSPAARGCVDLISTGSSPEPSTFLDASENGDEVFFLTTEQISKRDVDSSYDVYDARVGGGEPELAKPVECQGDACQTTVAPPEDLTPGSLTFTGPGNVVGGREPNPSSPAKRTTTKKTVKCKRGFTKKHNKCTKNKPKKKAKAMKATQTNRGAK